MRSVPHTQSRFLSEEITRLKQEKKAVILAHYYQEAPIQDVADFVGDSLGLSQQAAATKADIIVFAGVHFMAETAKILNPGKKVLLPDLSAGCSLADSCPPDQFKKFIEQHPGHAVVSYINCSAEIKAMSDVICTSSNAVAVIESFPKDTPIIFAPDKNLGAYLIRKTQRQLVLWDGVCEVHHAFSISKINALLQKHPGAQLIAHPESDSTLLELAAFIGSTSAMLKYVEDSPSNEFIVATEAGILHQMKKAVPKKLLIPAPVTENNVCACSECRFMKRNTLDKLYDCLVREAPEIKLDRELAQAALIPIQYMLEITSRKNTRQVHL